MGCAGLGDNRRRVGRRTVRAALIVMGGVATAIALSAPPARAETIRQAMASAYQNNPKLDAERARLRATDEEVPRALAGYRPRITGNADGGVNRVETKPNTSSEGESRPWGYSVTLSQPVFRGLRTPNAVSEAEAQVRAGREQLRGVEQQVLLETVTAFADVVRDQEVARLRETNVGALARQVTATEARMNAREVTRTDLAQAKARLARALSQLDQARGSLKSSRAAFERAVGRPPMGLTPPGPPKELLPRSLEEAQTVGEKESPAVIGALYRESAERHSIARIRGELLPDVRLEASYGSRFRLQGGLDEQESASLTGRLSMPLYEGGETYARVRQAKHRHVARLQEIEQARQETQAGVTQAWSRYQTTRGQLKSDRMQVDAARVAVEGVREEEKAGQRTVLDLLNAEQELVDAQVQLVTTRRELVVAAYALLSQMGRLTATDLDLTGAAYDPTVNYGEVRNSWFGLSITRADGRREIVDAVPDIDVDWLMLPD